MLSIPESNSVTNSFCKFFFTLLLLGLEINPAGSRIPFVGGLSSKSGARKETEWKTVKVKYNI